MVIFLCLTIQQHCQKTQSKTRQKLLRSLFFTRIEVQVDNCFKFHYHWFMPAPIKRTHSRFRQTAASVGDKQLGHSTIDRLAR